MALSIVDPKACVNQRGRVTILGKIYSTVSTPAKQTDRCEPIEVNTLDSAYTLYLPGCRVTTEGIEINVIRTSSVELPEVGTMGDLKLEFDVSVNGGVAATSVTTIPVSVTGVAPGVVEANGNRIDTYVISLQPTNIGRNAGTSGEQQA